MKKKDAFLKIIFFELSQLKLNAIFPMNDKKTNFLGDIIMEKNHLIRMKDLPLKTINEYPNWIRKASTTFISANMFTLH